VAADETGPGDTLDLLAHECERASGIGGPGGTGDIVVDDGQLGAAGDDKRQNQYQSTMQSGPAPKVGGSRNARASVKFSWRLHPGKPLHPSDGNLTQLLPIADSAAEPCRCRRKSEPLTA